MRVVRSIVMLCFTGFIAMNVSASSAADADKPNPQKFRIYIGTYTEAGSEGIYMAELDLPSGKLSPATLAAKAKDPSFLALHPTQPLLYAVSEISQMGNQKTGGVAAFKIENDGKLS